MARIRVSPRRGAADAIAILGQQIKAARYARKWTAADLAARISVDRRTVAAIEAGSPAVSIGNVLNAADILGVPCSERKTASNSDVCVVKGAIAWRCCPSASMLREAIAGLRTTSD